ncbi:glycoside hydrolase family 48 protein [Bacillus licheniformis]|nr:glycoside hydrolase family 48 protein [Bacillus licheniformis]
MPANLEWSGQPDPWKGFDSFTGNPGLHVTTKNPSQDVGVLGSYIKRSSSLRPEQSRNRRLYRSWKQSQNLAKELLDAAWSKMTESVSQQRKNMKIISATLRRKSTFRMAGAAETGRAIPSLAPTLCRLIRQRR